MIFAESAGQFGWPQAVAIVAIMVAWAFVMWTLNR